MTDPNMPGVRTDLGAGVLHDTKLMAYEVVKAARASGHPLFYVWGNGPTGDHAHGIAVDFMVYADGTYSKPGPERPDVGRWVADYVWEHHERLGVRYQIFSRRIRSTTHDPANIWTPYTGTDPHTNHVHVSRLANAPAYTGPTEPDPLPHLWLSYFRAARSDMGKPRAIRAHPETVLIAERALADFGFDPGPSDGHYGTGTDAAVRQFQIKVSGKSDGLLGEREWRRLAAGPGAGHPARFIAEIGTVTDGDL